MEFAALNKAGWSTASLQNCLVEFIQTANKYWSLGSTLGLRMGISFLMILTFKQQLCCQHRGMPQNTCGYCFVYEPKRHHRLTRIVASTQPLACCPESTCADAADKRHLDYFLCLYDAWAEWATHWSEKQMRNKSET